jgi:hypothetical protein
MVRDFSALYLHNVTVKVASLLAMVGVSGYLGTQPTAMWTVQSLKEALGGTHAQSGSNIIEYVREFDGSFVV